MRIELIGIGKRFGRQWVLKDINKVIEQGSKICITGPNGSGKSTLLKIIAGHIGTNEGEARYGTSETPIAKADLFKHIAIAAPYLDLYSDLSAAESIEFQGAFKAFTAGSNTDSMLNTVGLAHAAEKAVKDMSSGMKQRLKLSLALHSDTSLLLLDEPASNLDKSGIGLYLELIAQQPQDRTIIVCTNDPELEAPFCNEVLELPH